MNTALNRTTVLYLTNKSGGDLDYGDVVIVDATTASSFDTTATSGYSDGWVGVIIEPNGIANNANGAIAVGGYVPRINLSGSASLGDLVKTHTVAGQGVRHAAPAVEGDFALVLGTGTNPAAVLMTPRGASSGAPSTDGWTAAGETWTYASADDPTFTFTITGDVSGKYSAGMRVKLTQSTGGTKYFIITKVEVSTDTTITVYGGTDYNLENEAISSPYFSMLKAPHGFPLDPTKWTVEVTDTTARSQATPTQNVWYNLGSVTISVPIGCWCINYQVSVLGDDASAIQQVLGVTLSTANNAESDISMTARCLINTGLQLVMNVFKERFLTLATKTSYYLNTRTEITGLDTLYNTNSVSTLVIRAVCAYL